MKTAGNTLGLKDLPPVEEAEEETDGEGGKDLRNSPADAVDGQGRGPPLRQALDHGAHGRGVPGGGAGGGYGEEGDEEPVVGGHGGCEIACGHPPEGGHEEAAAVLRPVADEARG